MFLPLKKFQLQTLNYSRNDKNERIVFKIYLTINQDEYLYLNQSSMYQYFFYFKRQNQAF